RIDGDIAMICDPAQLVRCNSAHMVNAPHEGRHATDLARTMAGAGPVRRSSVPRHAGKRDVELRRIGLQRQPHERRNPGKPGCGGAIDRLWEGRWVHWTLTLGLSTTNLTLLAPGFNCVKNRMDLPSRIGSESSSPTI